MNDATKGKTVENTEYEAAWRDDQGEKPAESEADKLKRLAKEDADKADAEFAEGRGLDIKGAAAADNQGEA